MGRSTLSQFDATGDSQGMETAQTDTACTDIDVLAADGSVARIRDLATGDESAVARLHADASDRSIYLRFFSVNRHAADEYARTLVRGASPDFCALGAFRNSVLVGVAVYERIDASRAEFALLISDRTQHTGLGTLLLESLAARARRDGVVHFAAEVLLENARMIDVLKHIGFPVRTSIQDGVLEVQMDIADPAAAADAIGLRERTADTASLRPLLSPRSVAVVGASARPGSVGHEILRHVLSGGFPGAVYAVNPHETHVLGVLTVPSASALPTAVDLAVIAVPAPRVREVLRECGERGCGAAAVVSSGFGEAGPTGRDMQNDLLLTCRRYGMRLLGPNCLGILNTDPAVRLNATFARTAPQAGPLAIAAQSGAFGAGVMAAASVAGLGIAQFASLGNKADVGGNDLLLTWRDDPRIRVIAMYLESIGDPRRFVRIARGVARAKPILAVKAGRTEVGRRAGQSHTAAAASSDAAVDALFQASGVVRVETTEDLLDAARVLAGQPLLPGPRVAIVGNSGGPEVLAADTAAAAGLQVGEFGAPTRERLRRLGVAAQNPIDLGAGAKPETVAAVLDIVHASRDVDAVLTVFTAIAGTDTPALWTAVLDAGTRSTKPTVAVSVGTADSSLPVPGGERTIPIFAFPERAARALGAAWRYAGINNAPPLTPNPPADVRPAAARRLALAALATDRPWLPPDDATALLDLYGIPHCAQRVVHGIDEAVRAAESLGYPVVVKLAEAGLHKSDLGGVRPNLPDQAAVRDAARELAALDGYRPEAGLLVQPMLSGGTELIAGAVHDAQFGPLVMLGAGGVFTEVLHDRSLRLAPLTHTDAEEMIGELRTARLLDGFRGSPPVSHTAVQDLLVRVAALVDDVAQIAEMDLNPIICRGDELTAVDVRIRVAPPPWHPDPLLRQLRSAQPAAATSSASEVQR